MVKKSKKKTLRPVGKSVGERISALRGERGLTLEELASGTDLTPSYLSRLERGQTSISVDNLRNVAHFLGVEMVDFFDAENRSTVIVTRKGEGTPFTISGTSAYGESLVNSTQSQLQATLYRTPGGEGRAAYFSHPGDEFVLVIRGSIRYWIGSAPFELNTGDSLWHRSSEPHGWENAGQVDAVTLHVNTPPVWQRKQIREKT